MNSLKQQSNCVFCQIVKKELKASIVYENNTIIVFLDVAPLAKGHCLVVTKKCRKSILELDQSELLAINAGAQMMIKRLQRVFQPKGFNLVNNFNKIAGQVVNHYHLHIIPKYEREYGFSWKANPHPEKMFLVSVYQSLREE